MKQKQSERAERCLKYFGDIFGIKTKTAMNRKICEINAKVKAAEKEKRDADKQAKKNALAIQRKNKKEADRNYTPKHSKAN